MSHARPPYALPTEWRKGWQSMVLGPTGPASDGILSVPAPWRQLASWAP